VFSELLDSENFVLRAETAETLDSDALAKYKIASVPLAVIVKVSEQRKTSVPHCSILRILFVVPSVL
jgi:hypothetical protein